LDPRTSLVSRRPRHDDTHTDATIPARIGQDWREASVEILTPSEEHALIEGYYVLPE